MEMVIAATDDNALNHEIAEYCKAKDIMVNAVDQKADCSFIFPSYIKGKESCCGIFERRKQPCADPVSERQRAGDSYSVSW